MNDTMWLPDLTQTGSPQYVAIAEAIAADIASGRLAPAIACRRVAKTLGVNVSYIAIGYVASARRSYEEAHVGRGTFVRVP